MPDKERSCSRCEEAAAENAGAWIRCFSLPVVGPVVCDYSPVALHGNASLQQPARLLSLFACVFGSRRYATARGDGEPEPHGAPGAHCWFAD